MPHSDYRDKVWLNEACKLRGICDELKEARARPQTVFILAHFEDTLAPLETALQARALAYQRYPLLYLSTLGEVEPGTLVIALARELPKAAATTASPSSQPPLLVMMAEHHPLLTHDQDILQAVAALPCARPIYFHNALTDPLLVRFGSASIQRLFKQWGVDEQTPLSHSLISSAIQKAQAKLGKRVDAELRARSAEEWFQLNVPDGNK